MAGTLGGSFTLTAVIDGATYQGTIFSSAPMTQFYDKSTNTVSPDWTGGTNSPSFYMVIRDQSGSIISYDSSTVKIYYGGQLNWENGEAAGSGYIQEAGTITVKDSNEKEYTIQQYQFVKNVASSTNMDDDHIYMTADVSISGNSVMIQSSVKTIQIRATEGGSAYILSVVTKDIHTQGEVGTLTAIVTNQSGTTISNVNSYEWFDLTGSSETSIGTGQTLSRNSDQIDGYDAFKCVATLSDGSTKVSGIGGITDYSDPYYVDWELSPEGNTIRQGQTVTATPKLYSDDGTELTANTGIIDSVTMTATFRDSEGVDITADVPESNGTYTLKYDLVVEKGNQISGYITATVTLT